MRLVGGGERQEKEEGQMGKRKSKSQAEVEDKDGKNTLI